MKLESNKKMKSLIYASILLILISCHENPDSIKETRKINDPTSLQKEDKHLSLIVVDSNSNLIWMKNDFSFIKGRFLNNWNEIFEWEKEINSMKYAGYNDWRVPTIKEYRTINNDSSDRKKYSVIFNSINSSNVWGKGPYAFWSSTTPNKNTASYISFIDGFATSGSRAKQFSNPYSDYNGVELGMSVRLVRDKK